MSDKQDKDAKPAKGKGMLVKAVLGVVLVAAGGGGTFALVQSGVVGGGKEHVREDNQPKLVRKGEEDPFAPKAEGKEGEGPRRHRRRRRQRIPHQLLQFHRGLHLEP
jgi:flagellar FliL protein